MHFCRDKHRSVACCARGRYTEPTSRLVALSLLLCLFISGMSGCATQERSPFLTTPVQAKALNQILSDVRVELAEHPEGYLQLCLATVEEFLGRKDPQIRLILNDEQWNDYVMEQKPYWWLSLHNDLFREDFSREPRWPKGPVNYELRKHQINRCASCIQQHGKCSVFILV